MSILLALLPAAIAANPIYKWITVFVIATFVFSIFRILFRSRKIQPNGFRWKAIRNEVIIATISLPVTGLLLGGLTVLLNKFGLIQFHHTPARWYVVALEYILYFFLFDTWFYWFHRLMHVEPIYKWVHKVHHWSTSPNLITTLSVTPLESLINGGFLPIFTAVFVVHDSTMALIGPTSIVMGYYVHLGYEFLPRWWHKTWVTKWFITTTFHDQHHKYFNWNYGGYTQIWDWVCGTVRPKYVADFEKSRTRTYASTSSPVANGLSPAHLPTSGN